MLRRHAPLIHAAHNLETKYPLEALPPIHHHWIKHTTVTDNNRINNTRESTQHKASRGLPVGSGYRASSTMLEIEDSAVAVAPDHQGVLKQQLASKHGCAHCNCCCVISSVVFHGRVFHLSTCKSHCSAGSATIWACKLCSQQVQNQSARDDT